MKLRYLIFPPRGEYAGWRRFHFSLALLLVFSLLIITLIDWIKTLR